MCRREISGKKCVVTFAKGKDCSGPGQRSEGSAGVRLGTGPSPAGRVSRSSLLDSKRTSPRSKYPQASAAGVTYDKNQSACSMSSLSVSAGGVVLGWRQMPGLRRERGWERGGERWCRGSGSSTLPAAAAAAEAAGGRLGATARHGGPLHAAWHGPGSDDGGPHAGHAVHVARFPAQHGHGHGRCAATLSRLRFFLELSSCQ